MGKKPLAIGISAVLTAINLADAGIVQSLPGEAKQVCQPFAFPMRAECFKGTRVMTGKRITHIIADLECAWTDRRTEIGHQFTGVTPHRAHRVLKDAGCQSSPAGVRGGNRAASVIAQEDRQAIGRHHSTYNIVVASG